MKNDVYRMIETALGMDDSITSAKRRAILSFCKNPTIDTSPSSSHAPFPKLLSLKEAAGLAENPQQNDIGIDGDGLLLDAATYLTTEEAAAYLRKSVSWLLHRKDIAYYRGSPLLSRASAGASLEMVLYQEASAAISVQRGDVPPLICDHDAARFQLARSEHFEW